MKYKILILLVLFASISCKAQIGPQQTGSQLIKLNDDEIFDGIRFNNISLGIIMESKGDLNKMRAYFGNDIVEQANNSGPFIGKELSNNSIVFSFEDETDTGNNYDLSSIYVLDSTVVVDIKGLSIKLGDDKNKFGNLSYNSSAKSYTFTDQDTGSVGLSFKINSSNKVSAIKFIVY